MNGRPPIPFDGAPDPPRAWQTPAVVAVVQAMRERKRPLVAAVMGSGKSVCLTEVAWIASHKVPETSRIVIATSTQKLVRQLSKTVAARCGARSVGQFYADKKQISRQIIVACNDSLALLVDRLQAANLKVALLIVDEAHRSESEDFIAVVQRMAPASICGFSATPFRSEAGEPLSLFDVVPEGCSYSLGQALEDGVLVPWQIRHWDGIGEKTDVDGFIVRELKRGLPELAGPGVISADSIADAVAFAERLCSEGIPAAAVHSQLSEEAQETALRRLLAGELRCVVHVALFVEGVDIPEIRWMAHRRRVRSRVWFAQESGRGLRTMRTPDQWGEKKVCTFLDPYALFKSLDLEYPAELGEAMAGVDKKKKEKPEKPDFILPDLPEFQGRDVPEMVAVDAITAWTATLAGNMRLAGWVKRQGDLSDLPEWRTRKISATQMSMLRRLRRWRGHIPEPYKYGIEWLTEDQRLLRLTAGAASDLIDVLRAVQERAFVNGRPTRWSWPAYLPMPELRVPGVLHVRREAS